MVTTPEAVPRRLSFDRSAALYAAARPGYPPALFDALAELAGRPLEGARTVDVGAGTGIATRLLHERGARVTAVEPGPGMVAELRRSLPSVPVVRGDGNRLPLAGGSADLITYAQSWHWTDPVLAFAEAARVLRPGGALALWWNIADHTVDWVVEQDARLVRHFGDTGESAHAMPALTEGHPVPEAPGGAFVRRFLPWTRPVTVDAHLANLSSHSAFLIRGGAAEPRNRRFLEEERGHLAAVFPDGTVEERYVVDLAVAVLG
ncbi:SAM-dependent methyltransferase [Streptomyces nitrosporeus]|uniref:SAM-dependent methyltransferase n=1 Tax=Streptomyces nitrosporeus TaxID=28894 RepID=A0A5J6FFU6_9ACTN|nr:class I SAM-dependent methyltransferase [Streptomyces nitrosporeus]QEU73840.1 SAM-dependent methyltransferase [Streptomyces nitrosporeus]GGZ28894.1 methyltransferase [Streptomyces nitrosporeus]